MRWIYLNGWVGVLFVCLFVCWFVGLLVGLGLKMVCCLTCVVVRHPVYNAFYICWISRVSVGCDFHEVVFGWLKIVEKHVNQTNIPQIVIEWPCLQRILCK